MSQAIQSTTTPTRPTATPAVIYLPEVYSVGGNYFPELRTGDTTKATLVADIASSQHDDVMRVIAVDPASGTSWDASKEIAQAVLDVILVDYSRVPAWCEDFLERHLGVFNVRTAEAEYRRAA
jgi:hypothetical protein